MLHFKLIVTAVTICLIESRSLSIAGQNAEGAFLANTPGVSVEYLVINVAGKGTTGDLEVIAVSKSAPDGQVRSRTLAESDGDTLMFGSRVAKPSSGGYLVTSTEPSGLIGERRFIRTSVGAINAAIVALSAGLNRKRVAIDRQATAAQLRMYSAMSADDSRRLTKAQLSVDSASASLNLAQAAADRLGAVARQAWAEANAKVDESGVSLAQNQSREAALKLAAVADQTADVAQRQADLAGLALAAAKGDVQQVRAHIAMLTQRTRALASKVTTGETEGR